LDLRRLPRRQLRTTRGGGWQNSCANSRFDQTVIGNPNHDLIRLALSLSSAARGSDLPGVTTAHMLEQMMIGYQKALKG
jgi:uncharacterized protein (DUF2252 family)